MTTGNVLLDEQAHRIMVTVQKSLAVSQVEVLPKSLKKLSLTPFPGLDRLPSQSKILVTGMK
jgi:hypothetical protein